MFVYIFFKKKNLKVVTELSELSTMSINVICDSFGAVSALVLNNCGTTKLLSAARTN